MRDWRPAKVYTDTTSNNIHTITVPAGERWHVMSIWCSLATSNAGAAVRQVRLGIYDLLAAGASDMLMEIRPGVTQDSELTNYYNFYPGAADLTVLRDTDYLTTPIPPGLILNPGHTIIIEDESSVDTDADDLKSKVVYQMTRLSRPVA